MYKTLLLITGIVTAVFSAIILFETIYNIYNYINLKFVITKISIITDVVNFVAAALYAYSSYGFLKHLLSTKYILLFSTILLAVFYTILIVYLRKMISVEFIDVKTFVFRVSYSAFLTFIAWNFIMKLEGEKF